MVALVTCNNDENQFKHEGTSGHNMSPIISIWDFYSPSRAANSVVQGRIYLKFELIPAFIVVLITCKNEEDSITNEGARVVTTLYNYFQLSVVLHEI